jgi:uncharacterized protein DUF6152
MRKLFAAALLFSGAPLGAHHSISGAYYTDQQVKIEGTLVEFNYRNPHSFVQLEGNDPKTGAPTRFGVEWASVKRLERAGIVKETLKPGDYLVILGNPSRTSGDRTLHMVGAARKADGWKWGQAVQ